jgi:glycosyltransferase involved in cell wall biosynthesis
MRVLIAHNRYRERGGEDRHVALLEAGLRAAGIQTRLFAPDSAGLTGSPARRARAAALLAYDPGAAGIGRVLSEWRPDVVHFHNLWPLLTPAALRRARRAGARVVLTTHNCRFACPGGACPARTAQPDEGPLENACLAGSSLRCAIVNDPRNARAESLAYGFAQEVQRRLGMLRRWVDAFISPSDYVAAMLAEIGVAPERIHRIPNGVEVGEPTAPGSEHVLYAGRLDPAKGAGTLLRAAELATAPIAIAGAGELEAEVRRAPVRHLGLLDAAGVAGAMSRAAFTVVPSECRENAPYAVAESFASSRAVVASRIGGLPELVLDGRTGLLVEPGDPAALAAAIDRLWRDAELRARLGAEAHEVAQRELRLDHQVQRTAALYAELAGGP